MSGENNIRETIFIFTLREREREKVVRGAMKMFYIY